MRARPVASTRLAIGSLIAGAMLSQAACAENDKTYVGGAREDMALEDSQASLVRLPDPDGKPIRISERLSIHDRYDEATEEHRVEFIRDGRNVLTYPYQRHISVGISVDEKYIFINDNFASNESDCKLFRLDDLSSASVSEAIRRKFEYLSEYYKDHIYVDCVGVDSRGLVSIEVHGYTGKKQIDRPYSLPAEELL